jgi:hypothetical protein
MNISFHILNNFGGSLNSCHRLKSPTLPPNAWGYPLVWKLLHSYFKILAAASSTLLHQVVPFRFLINSSGPSLEFWAFQYQRTNPKPNWLPSSTATSCILSSVSSCYSKDMYDTFRHNILHATTIKLGLTSPHVTVMLLSAFLTLSIPKFPWKWVCLYQQ